MFDIDPLKARSLELAESHCGVTFGRDGKALCPVHNDRTPSLSYWAKGQRFKCWSCGWHGDIVALYQAVTGVAFVTAAQALGAATTELRPQRTANPSHARRAAEQAKSRAFRQMAATRDVLRRIADDDGQPLDVRIKALVAAHKADNFLAVILDGGAQ